MIHFNSNKILIPVDFSETSLLAIKHGAFLAKYTKGDVYLLHVINKQYEHYAVLEQPMHIEDPAKYETSASNKLNELADWFTVCTALKSSSLQMGQLFIFSSP